MDQLTRIAEALERIAVALEKTEEPKGIGPIVDPQKIMEEEAKAQGSVDVTTWVYRGPPLEQRFSTDHFAQRFGVDYSVMGGLEKC